MRVVKSKEFWIGAIAAVVFIKLVAPRIVGVPVVGKVAEAAS